MFGEGLGELAWVLVLLVPYFLPTVIAAVRDHHQTGAITALNIFLGWTVLGWIGAFVWACTAVKKEPAPSEKTRVITRQCPHCFGEVDARATVCRHCAREIPPLPATQSAARKITHDHREGKWKCPWCFREIVPTVKWCPYCKEPTEPVSR